MTEKRTDLALEARESFSQKSCRNTGVVLEKKNVCKAR